MQEIKEEWRDIEGYEGLYQVSNLGNIKSLGNDKKRKEKILKPNINNYGHYLKVCLFKQGKQKQYLVHRLVAQAFIPNPQNLPQINHKSEIKTDNRVENLEYCSAEYNNNYGTHNQRSAASRINHPKRSKQVLCVETGKIYSSTHQVERELGFANTYISAVCRGKTKTAYNFHWKYVN